MKRVEPNRQQRFRRRTFALPMIAMTAATPYYVLRDGNNCLGTTVAQTHAEIKYSTIYGFSDKGLYDEFCMNSRLSLIPYPLVKGFLRRLIATPVAGIRLVVIDPPGPCEPVIYAATFKAVLDAQENRTAHLSVPYQLTFDQENHEYRVEQAVA